MAPRAPSMVALRALRAQLVPDALRCRRCPSQQHLLPPSASRTFAKGSRRNASTLAPVTSVHATQRIPPQFKELHGRLKQLERSADTYVNLTQLSLALRGLESTDATIRVAVLDIQTGNAAKRLARVLLADALVPEQEWERALKRFERDEDDDKALLLKYGDEFGVDDRSPLHRTVLIPSSFLKSHRLEVLIGFEESPVTPFATAQVGLDRLLDINLAPYTTNGRHSRQLFPVHRAIVIGQGLSGLQAVGRVIEGSRSLSADVINGAVDGVWQSAASESTLPDVSLVNTLQAEEAIDAFRQSLDNAFKYEHGWLDSNVATLQALLSNGTTTEAGALKPILRNYIELVLRGAEASLLEEETERLAAITDLIQPATHEDLLRALAAWAEFAHTELRDELANALNSRTWRKIAWWKLLWRVDDIGLVMSDILQRSYLLNSEKYLLWIGGYFRAAGLHLADHLRPNASGTDSITAPAQEHKLGDLPTAEEVFRLVQEEVKDSQRVKMETRPSPATATLNAEEAAVVPSPLDPSSPWPQQISRSRNRLLNMIQPLQLRAQGIVLRTLSTSGLATAIGALAYVNVSDTSAYSAGAIAAFGTVWAFGGAQKDWNRAKSQWVQDVREEGKRVLEQCEQRGRELVAEEVRQGQERSALGGEGAEERRAARDAIAAAREALTQTPGEESQ